MRLLKYGIRKGFSTVATFKSLAEYYSIISLVCLFKLCRSLPMQFTFVRGNTASDFYGHFTKMAQFIFVLFSSCTYMLFRECLRVSMDWSRAQYNVFAYVFHTIAAAKFSTENKYLWEHIWAQFRGCKFHFYKNARMAFIDLYK